MARGCDAHNEEFVRLFAAHMELLEYSIGDQMGPLAELIVRVLNQRGQLTLKELADAMKRDLSSNQLVTSEAVKHVRCPVAIPVSAGDVATDVAIKELMTRLVLHRIVSYDVENHVYSVALGYGLFLRTLFPLIMQFFQRRYGETGMTLITVLYQLAVVPWDAAVRFATERRPALSEALRHCAREMESLGFIEFVVAGSGDEAAPPPSFPSSAPHPCRLNVGNILAEMLREAIQRQLVAERFADGGVAAAIVEAFTAVGSTRRSEVRPHGFPPAHLRTSASLPLRLLCSKVPFSEAVVLQTVSRMCRPDGDSLLSSDGTSAVAIEGPYRFHYDAAVEAMRRDCCERFVFARHGVLGVRIMKLLQKHHYMEDRMLSEEAIATLPRTREVLHAMLRDGYVRQQEVPRSGVLTDRQPRNAVFLWGCDMAKDLLPTVRMQVAKALRITLARLALERQTASGEGAATCESKTNSAAAFFSTTGTRWSGTEITTETLRCQRAVAALESSASALMEMMLVLDFY